MHNPLRPGPGKRHYLGLETCLARLGCLRFYLQLCRIIVTFPAHHDRTGCNFWDLNSSPTPVGVTVYRFHSVCGSRSRAKNLRFSMLICGKPRYSRLWNVDGVSIGMPVTGSLNAQGALIVVRSPAGLGPAPRSRRRCEG